MKHLPVLDEEYDAAAYSIVIEIQNQNRRKKRIASLISYTILAVGLWAILNTTFAFVGGVAVVAGGISAWNFDHVDSKSNSLLP